MGRLNTGFIIPAILYKNSKIKLNDLVKKVNDIDITYLDKTNNLIKTNMEFNHYNYNLRYNQGVLGVLSFLGLIDFEEIYSDFNHKEDYLNLSCLEIFPNSDISQIKYKVIEFLGFKKSKEKIKHSGYFFDKLTTDSKITLPHHLSEKQSVMWGDNLYNCDEINKEQVYNIEKILKEEIREFENSQGSIQKRTFYEIEISKIFPKYKINIFSQDNFFEKYQKYNPKNILLESGDSGYIFDFKNPYENSEGLIKWKRDGSEFYLDLEYILNNNMEHNFSSIVLTSEAIKKKYYNYLNYQSGEEFGNSEVDFLLENKDSHLLYLNKIKEFQELYYHRINNKRNTDYLRFRMLNKQKFNLDYERKILIESKT